MKNFIVLFLGIVYLTSFNGRLVECKRYDFFNSAGISGAWFPALERCNFLTDFGLPEKYRVKNFTIKNPSYIEIKEEDE